MQQLCYYKKKLIVYTVCTVGNGVVGEQSLSSTYLDNSALNESPPSPLTFQQSPGTHFYRFYGAISQTRLCQCESKHSITLAHLQIPIYLCIPLRRSNTSQSEELQYIKKQACGATAGGLLPGNN